MRVRTDEAADALYIRLEESAIVESEEVNPGVISILTRAAAWSASKC